MQYKKIFVTILAATSLVAAPAGASVGTGMQTWFNSMGGFSNATPPSAYKGQTLNGYSAGGMYIRSPPPVTTQLVTVTPPSLNIGCGGIDLTAGSFSFINQAALTSLFTNLGTSLGYAFLLSLKTSMPSIASTIEYLQDVANKVNGMNVNSCQMAQGIVHLTGADSTQAGADAADHMLGNITNNVPDSFSSWNAKRAQKDAALAAIGGIDPALKNKLAAGNVVWNALSRTSGLDQEDKQFIMSMTGTIIISPSSAVSSNPSNPPSVGAPATWAYRAPTVQNVADLIGYVADGPTTPFQLLVCDEAVRCMNPQPGPITATTFMSLVGAKLDNLRNNLLARSKQNVNDLHLVEVSSLPVWKMISVSASVHPTLIDSYKRLIAVDLAYNYFESVMSVAYQTLASERNGSNVGVGSREALKELTDRLDVIEKKVLALRQIEYAAVSNQADLERELQLLNQTMVAGLPAQAFNSMTVFGGAR